MSKEGFYDHLRNEIGLGEVTIKGYRKVLKGFLKRNPPTKKAVKERVAYLKKNDYSYSHIANTTVILERYMKYIGKPLKLERPKKERRVVRDRMSEGEIARIIAASKDSREKAIVSVLAYSGVRNKELRGLRVRDVDLGRNELIIRQGKNSTDRIVPIAPECAEAISRYLGEYPREKDEYLFTTLVEGEQYSSWALRDLVKTLAERADIEKRVYPHLFRHSLATNLLNNGASITTIQKILGHKNIETTLIYARSSPEQVRRQYLYHKPKYK